MSNRVCHFYLPENSEMVLFTGLLVDTSVAFHAYMSDSHCYTEHEVIVFDRVEINIGIFPSGGSSVLLCSLSQLTYFKIVQNGPRDFK